MGVHLPRSIVTDHYLLDHIISGSKTAVASCEEYGPANNCQFRMILISKYNYRLKPKMDTLVFDIYGIILYSVILT